VPRLSRKQMGHPGPVPVHIQSHSYDLEKKKKSQLWVIAGKMVLRSYDLNVNLTCSSRTRIPLDSCSTVNSDYPGHL
jgi:hypothetical protein